MHAARRGQPLIALRADHAQGGRQPARRAVHATVMEDARTAKRRRSRRPLTSREPDDTYRPWWLRPELTAVVLAVLCYINTPSNDFCDDGTPIVRLSAKVNEPGQWLSIWTTDYWYETKDATPNRDLLYRPVALTSYRLVRSLAGPEAKPQLLVNVLIHALIAVAAVRICRHLAGDNVAALVAGAVVAVMPIHTEVINNAVGRADLLAALGALWAVLAHRRSMNATIKASIVRWRIVAALAAFVAMGAKESGVAVVPLLVLLDGYWYRRWRFASFNRPWWSVAALWRFAYLAVPLGTYLGLRYFALQGQLFQRPALTKTVNLLVDAPPLQHVLGVIQLWGMYWQQTVWPAVLCINYSINAVRLATEATDPDVLAGLAGAAGLLVASVAAWRRGTRSVAYLSGAVVISCAPTANALVLIQVFYAERIWYLPSLWIAMLAGVAVARFVRRPVWCLLAAIAVLAMMERCWVRNAEWQNDLTLYAAAYRDHPNAVGVLRLYGQTLVDNDRIEEGLEKLKRAVDIDLGFTDAQRSLGQAYLRAGDYESALRHLQIADMQVPHHPATSDALAYVSRWVSALHEPELERLRAAVAANPDDPAAEVALVAALRAVGRIDEAVARLEAGEARFGQSVAWQSEYAVTLVYLNRRDRAIERYWKCVELDPADPRLAVELAMLLLERREGRDLEQAEDLAERADKLAPGAPPVLACQAELAALRGELASAARLYQRAMERLPAGSEQRHIYEQRAAALGY